MHGRIRWYVVCFLALAAASPAVWFAIASWPSADASTTPPDPTDVRGKTDNAAGESGAGSAPIRVETVQPQKGGIQRKCTQIGSVIAFESARLYAKVSGYLKSQDVDIGSKVHRGQVLAEIDAPELLKEVDQAKAALAQTKAQVLQANARVATAQADREAAAAAIEQAQADIDKTLAFSSFREKQYQRMYDLLKLKSVDARVVDEKQDEMEAARAAVRLARASVLNAKALAAAAAARVDQANADVVDARAKVDVAQAAVEKAQVFAGYVQIVSPYDGVVTQRAFFPGDFIRSAEGSQVPLLSVDRIDLMRFVVEVPDLDAPFTHRGNQAVVEVDALPGVQLEGQVARTANAQEKETRLMRVEIDLPNDKNLLHQGMYGRVTIQLGALPGALRIPSSALVGEVEDGNAKVYVCKDGLAHLVPVRVGRDDGLHIDVLKGLSTEDQVVPHPSGALFDGARVSILNSATSTPDPQRK